MLTIGSTAAGEFTTRNPDTGVESNADSIPTGVLVLNGVDTAVTVTITEKETGVYKWSAPISSTYSRGDRVQIRIAATIAGKTDNFDVCDDSADLSQAALISAIRQGLRSAQLTVQSPVIGEKVSLFAETDYASDTMLLSFESDEWPVDLSVGEYDDVQLHCRVDGTEMEVGTCTITQAGLPGTQIVEVALTNAETLSLGVAVDAGAPFRASLTSNYTLWAIKNGSPDKKWPLSNSTLAVESVVWYTP